MQDNLEYWETIFDTGNQHIDNQHKKLFELVKDFSMAYVFKKDKDVIKETLFQLEDYTIHHFSDEEKVLSQTKGLPSKNHIKQHQDFVKFIKNVRFEYVSDNKDISEELFDFLTNWLREHILNIDKVELTKHQSTNHY